MSEDYDHGFMAGKILHLEDKISSHERQLQEVTKQMKYIERILWMLIGIGAFIQILPALSKMVGS